MVASLGHFSGVRLRKNFKSPKATVLDLWRQTGVVPGDLSQHPAISDEIFSGGGRDALHSTQYVPIYVFVKVATVSSLTDLTFPLSVRTKRDVKKTKKKKKSRKRQASGSKTSGPKIARTLTDRT